MSQEPKFIDSRTLTLDEWLRLIFTPSDDKLLADYEFPTDNHRDQYLENIENYSEDDIQKLLLKFLIPSGSLGIDDLYLEGIISAQKNMPELFENMKRFQFNRRLVLYKFGHSQVPPWEGITWILDLLPSFPKQALEGLSAYTTAHTQFLTDERRRGLYDAAAVIRTRYIGVPIKDSEAVELLLSLSSRDFEHIVERLYSAMEYETHLTSPQKDGGRDVIAVRKEVGKLEQLVIECKRYTKPVGVGIVRALLGVTSDEKVNKGVLVTTNRFTRGAKDFVSRNPRLEIISGNEVVLLLNKYCGARWSSRIEEMILESQRKDMFGS